MSDAMISVRQALDAAWQHHRRGEWQQAERLSLQVVERDPDQVDALNLLGAIAGRTGREDQAIDYLQKVLRLRPSSVEAHNNLGGAFAARRRFPEAVASFQEAVRLQPGLAVLHNNLGNALREGGRPAEAVASLQQALRIRPDHAEAHRNLGLAWSALERLPEAQACFREAVRLKPDFADAHLNLGTTLLHQGGRLDDAIDAYRTALRLRPDFAEAHVNLGNALKDRAQLDDAIAAYRRGVQIRPDAADIHSHLVFVLPYHPAYDSGAVLEECRRWNHRHAEPLKPLIPAHGNHRDPGRRLRIGYVSPDFRRHVQSFFTMPLLSHHDHSQFEVFCYADVLRADSLTERLRGHADAWRDTVGLTDQQVAERVRDDRIDILVNLVMHMAGNRLLVFARKPAPIQVSWLAYPGTTGLDTIDYRLTDPYLDPPGLFDACYAEQSVRLPETFWCYDPLTDGPPVDALPAASSGVVTFGSLNNFCKINDGCLALWARVLRAVPRSRLLLHAPAGLAREHVLATLEQEGITATRVEFADRLPRAEYLALYNRMDLGLDPVPCNGHTTSLDASWMGVPTITLVSRRTAFGRAGWSQSCNLGLQELAAETPEDYVAIAVRLAGDLSRLRELRETSRRRMQQSPLMDARRFARHMEEAYRRMWHAWCQAR